MQCAATAVLELRDQCWRFAHDKLREQLLADLSEGSQRQLHRQVAAAIEGLYPGRPDLFAALAHHWGQADDAEREAHYAYEAGMLALYSGACREAVGHLTRALALVQMVVGAASGAPDSELLGQRSLVSRNGGVDPASPSFRLGTIEGALTDAYFRLGDLHKCREHAARALHHFGRSMPIGRAAFLVAAVGQAVPLALRALLGRRPAASEPDPAATAVARVQMRLIDSFFYALQAPALIWSVLSAMNQCEAAGPSPELARAYVLGGLLASLARARRLATAWCERGLHIAQRTGSAGELAWVLSRVSTSRRWLCRWDEAIAHSERALAIAREVGDARLCEETLIGIGRAHLHTGQLEKALEYFREAHESTLRSGDVQLHCCAILLRGAALVGLGRERAALALFGEALGALTGIDQLSDRSSWTSALCLQSLVQLRTGDETGAHESAARALSLLTAAQPVGDWMQHSTAALAEVLLTLLESGAGAGIRVGLENQARQAVHAMRRFARRFPVGRPHALLWSGLLAWVSGHRRLARRRWRRAVDAATRLQMPYELGRAHLELGRHLPLDAPARLAHLDEAVVVFQRLGCATELVRARAERERCTSVVADVLGTS